MSDEPSIVGLADATSELLYEIAGWLLIGLGLASFLSGVGGIVQRAGTPDMVVPSLVLVVAFVLLGSGLLINPRTRRRLQRRHSPSQFGRVRTVDERVFSPAENRRETCVSCDSTISAGLVRRYREEYAVAGVPVGTVSKNYNFYCPECAMEERGSPSEMRAEENAAAEQFATDLE